MARNGLPCAGGWEWLDVAHSRPLGESSHRLRGLWSGLSMRAGNPIGWHCSKHLLQHAASQTGGPAFSQGLSSAPQGALGSLAALTFGEAEIEICPFGRGSSQRSCPRQGLSLLSPLQIPSPRLTFHSPHSACTDSLPAHPPLSQISLIPQSTFPSPELHPIPIYLFIDISGHRQRAFEPRPSY